MLKKFRIGGVFLGLALIVSFFVVAPANAGIIRGDENEEWGLKLIRHWDYRVGNGSGVGGGGGSSTGGGGSGSNQNQNVIRANIRQNSLTLKGNERTMHQLVDGGYAISFDSLGGGDLDFLHTVSASLQFGSGESVSLDVDHGMSGSFFYFPSLDTGEGDRQLTFSFANTNNQDYRISLWEVTAIPEPTTLAILGLGLAGLGLARRRIK